MKRPITAIFLAVALASCTPVSSLLVRKQALETLSKSAVTRCTSAATCAVVLPCLSSTAKALSDLADRNRQVVAAQGLVDSMVPTAWLYAVDGPAITACKQVGVVAATSDKPVKP